MLRMRIMGLIAAALLLFAAPASATVVTFDDLSGSGFLANGYGGINWGNQWQYYDSADSPGYNPASPPVRIYSRDTDAAFSFLNPTHFSGAYFNGYGASSGLISFDFYLNNVFVGSSGTLDPTGGPSFLASAYAGLVDKVVVIADANYYIMDDVTYTSAVPLPAALPLFAAVMAGFGFVNRRRAMRQQI